MWQAERYATFCINSLGQGNSAPHCRIGKIGHNLSESEGAFSVRKEEEKVGDWDGSQTE